MNTIGYFYFNIYSIIEQCKEVEGKGGIVVCNDTTFLFLKVNFDNYL